MTITTLLGQANAAAEAAPTDGNAAGSVFGWLCIGFVIWLICLACKPKGWDVRQKSHTTITPRR